MKQSLLGLTVIITRPQGRGLRLSELILDQGGLPIEFPTLAIEPLDDLEIQGAVDALLQYDLLIFTSKNAVDHFIPRITLRGLPPCAAIGPATAHALATYHLVVNYIPAQYNSEHLLALLLTQGLQNKRVLLVSGEGGRDILEQELTKQGVLVKKLPVYRRRCPPVDEIRFAQITQQNKVIILATSCESALNLMQICQQRQKTDWLRSVYMLVISRRIKDFIIDHTFPAQQILLAQNGSDEAILETLIKWYA